MGSLEESWTTIASFHHLCPKTPLLHSSCMRYAEKMCLLCSSPFPLIHAFPEAKQQAIFITSIPSLLRHVRTMCFHDAEGQKRGSPMALPNGHERPLTPGYQADSFRPCNLPFSRERPWTLDTRMHLCLQFQPDTSSQRAPTGSRRQIPERLNRPRRWRLKTAISRGSTLNVARKSGIGWPSGSRAARQLGPSTPGFALHCCKGP